VTRNKASVLNAAIDEDLTSRPDSRGLDDIWVAAEARSRASNG